MFTALLPMKLHSERVKNKNFRLISNKPLYKWMLDKLILIKEIDTVIINTDADPSIFKDYVKSGKVYINSRPKELCGDFVSMNDIIANDLELNLGDDFFMTHTTNPLLSASTIITALATYSTRDKNVYDSMYSVTRLQARFNFENNVPINHSPGPLLRTQDLPPVYMENSCFFVFNRTEFEATKSRIGNNPLMFETPHLESVDIDTEEDWYLAELLLNNNLQM
jgi:CMP-N-acetylneuraminic acid synthetase